MKLKDFKNTFQNTLAACYPKQEIQSFFKILARHYLGFSPVQIILHGEEVLEKNDLQKLESALIDLKKNVPIQYITSCTSFKDLKLKVNSHTLIPRVETEQLVDWVVADFKNQKSLKILDIGSGSGCISIALKKNLPQATLHSVDICEKALAVALENATANNVTVHFKKRDIFKVTSLDKYDAIVSNPPYVRESEKKDMQKNILLYEPAKALFVPNDNPLIFYKKIAQLALHSLNKTGGLYFEINATLHKELLKNLQDTGFKTNVLREDIFGKPRMVKASL